MLASCSEFGGKWVFIFDGPGGTPQADAACPSVLLEDPSPSFDVHIGSPSFDIETDAYAVKGSFSSSEPPQLSGTASLNCNETRMTFQATCKLLTFGSSSGWECTGTWMNQFASGGFQADTVL
jgi:hypothetical protein